MYKTDSDESRRRVEAWWNHEMIDRAVIQVTAPRRRGSVPFDNLSEVEGNLERYFTDPEIVVPRVEARLAQTYFGGEAFPVAEPIRTVAILASYLGCPVKFVDKNTIWSEPIIENPDEIPELRFDRQNRWWKISEQLMKRFAERADGYYVAVPDLNGPTEILARMRGTENLALDFAENPDYIKPAVDRITRSWYECLQECTAITQKTDGYFYWMGIWSDKPSIDLQSDFSCMISRDMFNDHFLPSIEEQTRLVDRTIYHLDGPGAIRHLDALLSLPRLDGIQWVPGAGAKPTVEWIPLLKRIQDAGKLVFAYCDKSNVEKLLSELDPKGLMIVTSCDTPEEADELLANAKSWSAG